MPRVFGPWYLCCGVRKEEGPFFRALGEGARRRLELVREGKKILDFVVQLEIELETEEPHGKGKRWVPIVRYDTAHGVPHRDQYNREGRQRKTFLDAQFDILTGYRGVVEEALRDLEERWRVYRERYLRGEWPIP